MREMLHGGTTRDLVEAMLALMVTMLRLVVGPHMLKVGLKRSQRASWSSASTAAAVAARKRARRRVRGKSDGMRSARPPRRAAVARCTSFHRSDICQHVS